MQTTLKAEEALQEAQDRILRHMEWQPEGFALFFLFADLLPARELAARLDEQLRPTGHALQRTGDLHRRLPNAPEALIDDTVTKLSLWSSVPGPVWFELHQQPADAAWQRARRIFMARLNERRFLLERDLSRPLLLVLPANARQDIPNIAPDLWHIRVSSHTLRTDGRNDAMTVREATSRAYTSRPTATDAPTPAYDEWLRLMALNTPERVFLPASRQAIDELLNAGRPGDALEVVRQAEAIARARSPNDHEDTDLAFALDEAGKVACAQGDWEQAQRVYTKSLDISRQRITRLGDTPETLRDLSISLNHVGLVTSELGDWTQAERVYAESLDISRRRIEQHGDTPEALRDLLIALNNVGSVASVQGDWTQAKRIYTECLEISRQLVDRLGGTPEALRDLSISLDSVGRIASVQGDWAQAERIYTESLEISRQLITSFGETPKALRDLSVSLDNVGEVARAQGNWAQAERLYTESLEISRQLVERLGGNPQALRDLSISLNNVGGVAHAQGDWAQASRVYRESLEIRRQLVEQLGDTPDALDDLASSLINLGALPGGDAEARHEAETIYASLVERFPMVLRYREQLSKLRAASPGSASPGADSLLSQ
jgi:tetratricopeptide (TPR) repeat protein